MPRSPRRIPKYRHHRSTGRAVVTLNGRDIYLGQYGSPESHALYARLIAEWTAGGGNMPVKASDIAVTEVIAQFWSHAEQIYSPSELANFRTALRPLKALYGDLPTNEFGPRSLRAVRQKMVEKGWTRENTNKQVGRLKHVFKWAVSQELIPPAVYHGLLAVEGLRRGRTDARETEPVRPVPQKLIDAVLPLVSRRVAGKGIVFGAIEMGFGRGTAHTLKLARFGLQLFGRWGRNGWTDEMIAQLHEMPLDISKFVAKVKLITQELAEKESDQPWKGGRHAKINFN